MSDNYNQTKPYSNTTGSTDYQNAYGEPSQLPMNYNYFPSDTDKFYEDESSSTGSFLMGALVGGVIGAAAALFLAPKTGKEMREDFSDQAVQLKNKSIELGSTAKDKAADLTSAAKDKAADLSSTAKDKASQLTSTAKDKSGDLKKTVQDQTDSLTDKVKSMTSKTKAPMDDGTASSEGEEPIIGKDSKDSSKSNNTNSNNNNNKNSSKNNSGSSSSADKNMSAEKKEASSQTTKNSDVAYDNSANVGDHKIINQNPVSDEKPKNK